MKVHLVEIIYRRVMVYATRLNQQTTVLWQVWCHSVRKVGLEFEFLSSIVCIFALVHDAHTIMGVLFTVVATDLLNKRYRDPTHGSKQSSIIYFTFIINS